MQIVRHSAIDGFDRSVSEQFMIIGERPYTRKSGGEPGHCRRVRIAYRDDVRLHVLIEQVTPACRGTRKLAPHQATPDDAKIDRSHACTSINSDDACAGVAFSCTMDMSACVMPRGLRCWTTLRPYTIPAAPACMTA